MGTLNTSVRWISARDLTRSVRGVLDEVSTTGRSVLVTRFGHPVAMISPVGETARRVRVQEILSSVPKGAYPQAFAPDGTMSSAMAGAPEAGEADERVLLDADLTPSEEAVLLAAEEGLRSPDALLQRAGVTLSELGPGLGRLEVKGFLRRISGAYGLTPEGARVRLAIERLRS